MSAEKDDVTMDDAVAAPVTTAVPDTQSAGAPHNPHESDATNSQGSSDSESCPERQWVEALTGDPPIAGCTLDETAHAAAHEMGARVSVRVPTVSRLVRLEKSYIVDDEPTGALFVQMLTDVELWPIPELDKVELRGPRMPSDVTDPQLAIAPDTNQPSLGDRFLTRMCAYPLLKGTALQKQMARSGADGISSLIEPFVAAVPPNEQLCQHMTRGKHCQATNCALRHASMPGALPEELTTRLLDLFEERDQAALASEIAARAEAGATPAEILRHVTLESGPLRLDSLINASARRCWTKTRDEAAPALRELARGLSKYVRLPGTTSYAADALLPGRKRDFNRLFVDHQALMQMTLCDNGRLDERSDKGLDLLRQHLAINPHDRALWHVFVDLSLLRIPEDAIEEQRALLEKPLQRDANNFTPLFWWKALAVERRGTPQTQMALLRRMLPARKFTGKRALGGVHAGNVLFAIQRLVGEIDGPAAAIGYIRALLCATVQNDVRALLDRDPLEVSLEADRKTCDAPFKCGILVRILDPRFVVLLATAMAHWMTYGAPLPVQGLPELGGAFHAEAPLILLQPVAYPKVLRCVFVFQSIANSFRPLVPKQWLDSGAYLAVALNMVRCGWVHQPNESLEKTFEHLRKELNDSAAYYDMLTKDDSLGSSFDAFQTLANSKDPPKPAKPARPLEARDTAGMRIWHMLRTILQHAAWCRVSQTQDAAQQCERTLALLTALLQRLEQTRTKRKNYHMSVAGCADLYLLESLVKGAAVPGTVAPVRIGEYPATLGVEQRGTILVQAHMAMELASAAREPQRAPAGALLVLGNMLCQSDGIEHSYGMTHWLLGENDHAVFCEDEKTTRDSFDSHTILVLLNIPVFPEVYHIIARRYFEFGMPFSISCTPQEQPTAPCGGYADCRPPASCDLCEDALALTRAHRDLLLLGPGDAPIQLVAEACERLLFQLMSHGGAVVESVETR